MRKPRNWTAEQKLSILKEAEQIGTTAAIRKHDIYAATFYGWRTRYEQDGIAGLDNVRTRLDPELKRLQLENQRLKSLLADKELELSIKTDLLKKTNRHSG